MLPYTLDSAEVTKMLETDAVKGLSSAQAAARLEEHGANKLPEKKKKGIVARFLNQFKDVMILILIAAAIVSFVTAIFGHSDGEFDPVELFEPLLILLIVIINAVLGVMQEGKAEKALEALKQLSSPHARVIRDGAEKIIDASELVPGDIIKLEAGDFVPADARLIKSSSLKSEESALTGESVPSEKSADELKKDNAPLGDRTNMVYSGCSISYGTAIAVVTGTGIDTEMGKIANLLEDSEDVQTPLQQKLSSLGKYLGIIALTACAVIFVMGIIEKKDILEIFMVAVSLAVSAIPEGLPAIITIVLSIGVQRMAKKNAIVRRLPAVETLGSASIICSDKTGTLTQNRMTLVEAYSEEDGEPVKISDENEDNIKKLLTYGTLCSDGAIIVNESGIQHVGDPTETSIIYAAYRNGITKEGANEKFKRLFEIPFDSDRKLMSTVNVIDGKMILIVKGAFDVIQSRCVKGNLEKAAEINKDMSSRALRVLAVAYKEVDGYDEKARPEDVETGLTFLGLVGMIDPPRPEVKDAVKVCKKAGIKPIMITGDHVITAGAIAKELGILNDGEDSITGAELDLMTDTELDARLEKISVYARVSPENKIRIVRAWQRKDKVVSMTGDGVNDAPALKAADIGCAMGITGTDVAKGAADLTLTDDNFTTIVEAVKEGRGIYANIKKVVAFLLGTNLGEILTVFLAMVIWKTSPLLSMQLLMINLVTDSLPAVALGMEKVEKDIMDHSPKPKKEGLFAHGLGIRVGLYGVLFGSLTLIAYRFGVNFDSETGGETMAFMVLALSQIVQAYNMRSSHSLFKIGVFSNKKLNYAALLSCLLVSLVLFVPPIQLVFEVKYLSWQLYLIGLGLALAPFPILEISKLFFRKKTL